MNLPSSTIANQFIRYFGVALVGYAFDFGSLVVLHELFSVHYLIAASVGFISGLVVVYVLSNRYVFGQSKIQSRTTEIALFTLVGLVGLVILNLLMWLMTGQLHISYIVSKIVATIFVYAWNFLARRSLYHN